MSELRIYSETCADKPLEILTRCPPIRDRLGAVGVTFQRWKADSRLDEHATQDEVIAAYQSSVDTLMDRYGFHSVDVISVQPQHPEKELMRRKFLQEHTHDDHEIRFFVDGAALFYLHADAQVYGMLCTRGDLISVPARMRHWFDMGPEPSFKAIRMFTTPDGWVAQYTGDSIASRFPPMEAPYYPIVHAA